MASGFVIRKNQYYDSVFLMSANARMLKVKGVKQTAVLMGSQANKQLLREIGIQGAEIDAAQPNDLIVAATADSMETVFQVLGNLDGWLNALQEDTPASQLHTLEDGLAMEKAANLAVISIPGEYAAHEARKAIEAGLNVSFSAEMFLAKKNLSSSYWQNKRGCS